jgi:hypothetical protein
VAVNVLNNLRINQLVTNIKGHKNGDIRFFHKFRYLN